MIVAVRFAPSRGARRAWLHAAGAGLLAALAGGCATLPPPAASEPPKVEASFAVAGRISARRGNDAVAANFAWEHAPARDRFDLSTPLGQVVARMEGDPAGVRVQRPGEAPAAYTDWNALTRDVFGVAIPVRGLAAWIQAAPTGEGAYDLERGDGGRPAVLREQGWEIVYAYDDATPPRPRRLVMRYPDSEPIEVRIVVDRWSASAP